MRKFLDLMKSENDSRTIRGTKKFVNLSANSIQLCGSVSLENDYFYKCDICLWGTYEVN